MLFGRKKITVLFAKKNDRGNAYLKADLPLRSVPGQGGQHSPRGGRLARIRQRLRGRKNNNQMSYRPVPRKKVFGSLTGAAIMIVTVLAVCVVINSDKILHGLQSIAYFQLTEITFTGCDTVSEDHLREVADLVLYQTSLIGLDSSQLEKKLMSVPWVAQAEVRRHWPSSIEILISENRPVALLHLQESGETELHYIDKKGLSFLEVKPGAYMDYPVITGLSDVADSEVKASAFSEVLVFLNKLRNNHPYLPVQAVSEIHVTPDGEMVIYLVEYPFPIFFGNGNTKTKYARLIEVLKELYKKQEGKELISRIEYIQMDYFDEKVLVAQSGSD